MKRVRIRSYSGPYLPAFGMRENTDQNNSEYGLFLRHEDEKGNTGMEEQQIQGEILVYMALNQTNLT